MGETAKVLTIRLRVQDDGSVVLDRASKGIDKLASSEREAAANAKNLSENLSKLHGDMSSLAGAAKLIAGAWITREAFDLLKSAVGEAVDLVKRGVEFNGEMQTSRLSIAAMVTGYGEIRGAHGQILQGQERWNAALQISGDLQKRMFMEAQRTGVAIQDLAGVLRMTMAPALQTGVTDMAKIVDLATRLGMAGQALGFQDFRLQQEVRSIMMGQRNTELGNVILGDISQEKFEELRRSGELVQFLIDRLKSFDTAAVESANTFEGSMKRLKNAFDMALGSATAEATDSFTQSIKELAKEVKDPQFVSGIRDIANLLAIIASLGISGVKAAGGSGIIGMAIDAFGALKDMGADSSTPFGDALATAGLQTLVPVGGQLLTAQAFRDQFLKAYMERQAARSADIRAEEAQRRGDSESPSMNELLRGQVSATGKRTPLMATKEQEAEMRKIEDDYLASVKRFRRDAEAAGDPLKEALARIEDERDKRINALKEQAEKMKEAVRGDGKTTKAWFAEKKQETNALFDEMKQQASFVAAIQVSRENSAGRLAILLGGDPKAKELALRTEREIADGRMAIRKELSVTTEELIANDLTEKLTANAREFEDTTRNIDKTSELYAAAADARKQKDKAAWDYAILRRAQDTVGTKQWADNVRKIILQQIGTAPELVTKAVISSRLAMTSELEKFFGDVVDGNADVMKSIEGLAHDLGHVFAQEFAGILTNGRPVLEQLKQLYGLQKQSGSQSSLDAGLMGAGVGSFVGGAFQKPGNYAGLGGTAGGIVGGIIGYFAGNPALGAYIGSAIGTALGASIQKGKDSIKVAIEGLTLDAMRGASLSILNPNGTSSSVNFGTPGHPGLYGGGSIDISEKGISAETRAEILVQIQRKTKEQLKSWQSILDMLPQTLKDELAKMPPPSLTLKGGVEEGDIRDESALTTLSDFLSDKMPKAVYGAYHDSIQRAMTLLGVDTERSKQLFEYWGTMTGAELHDAVQRFFKAVIEGNDLRGKFSGGFEARYNEAQASMDQTPLGKLKDINAQIGVTVASMSKLTDIEDVVSSQERLNELSKEYIDTQTQAVQQLIGLQRQLRDGNQSLQEQIRLGGMNDQEKINYYYGQINNLRELIRRTTDPQELAKIEQKLNAYVQAAFGLAPDNNENRDKLLGILQDVNDIRDTRFGYAQQDLANDQQKAATMLQDAAKILLQAGVALNPNAPEQPTPGGGGGDGTKPGGPYANSTVIAFDQPALDSFGGAVHAAMDDLPQRIAEEIKNALENVVIHVEGNQNINVTGTDGLVDATAGEATLRITTDIRRNPDKYRSRVGGRN